MPNAIEIEQQAQKIIDKPMQQVIKNIKARLPHNWGFGIIFYERSRTSHAPTLWVSSTNQKDLVDVADAFVRASRKAGKG